MADIKKDRRKKKDLKNDESSFVDSTPVGQKKDMSVPMLDKYNPFQVEAAWDCWWEEKGFYKPSMDSDNEKFVMVIPPPNVTGALHIGHALTNTVEDCLTRWHRMCGKNVLWLPGMDHAGIATQSVVERRLLREKGLTRHDLGREKFLKEVWQWKEAYGGVIREQIRKMGSSVDWSREVFTMDEKLSRAVIEAFVRMHRSGKVYRATRLVNWSCHLHTAISDCEVDKEDLPGRRMLTVPGHGHKVEFGVMHKFGYKLVDSDEQILIETTRPETMLGDSGVAVHPKDPRYQHLIGKYLQHPFLDRKMIIVADDILVDMEKGTGVVKVTPAHDPNDFDCGQRHNLEQISILSIDGKINENGGKYAGMMRFDCRFQILKDLEALGQYHGKRDNPQALGFCSRSGDVIEPVLRPQWWVDCKEMAKRSADAVRNGDLQILPEKDKQTFFHFMDNIRPWCISRQLWWGHRIPAFLPVVKGQPPLDPDVGENWIIAKDKTEAMKMAVEKFGTEEIELEQDPDVLDTWFSSGLFPFAVFGWPEENPDLKKFYPGELLETGRDILFFWVARMTMMSLELNDKLPFKTVFLHPMVRAADGSKMSKSKGNVVNPLHVISGASIDTLVELLKSSNLPEKEIKKYEKLKRKEYPNGFPACGADALRFSLLAYMSQGRSINLDVNRIIAYRQHCNKMWQATKFCMPKLSGDFVPPADLSSPALASEEASFADRWILSRLAIAESTVEKALTDYDFGVATNAIYDFWLKDLCDVYIELVKPLFPRGEDAETPSDPLPRKHARAVLYTALERGLRLLHPFMPFISEELWQRLPGRKEGESIVVAKYPTEVSAWRNEEVESEMKLAQKIAKTVRSAAMGLNIGNTTLPLLLIKCSDPKSASIVSNLCAEIGTMSSCAVVEVVDGEDARLKECIHTVVDAQIGVYMQVKGLVDFSAQLTKLSKQHKKLESMVNGLKKKTSNEKYLAKTPARIQEQDKEKLIVRTQELEKLAESISEMESLCS
eukprot:67898_1